MRSLADVLLIEKNRLASPYPWVPLVHFAFPSPVGDIWLAGNIEDVTFGGQLYTAFHIEVELPEENVHAVVPECIIHVANQSRAFESLIIQTNGGVDTTVTIVIVNTNNLTASYSELTWTYNILQVNTSNEFVDMTCSLYSPLDKRFPPDRYYGSTCRHILFKGVECKYVGSSPTTCDRNIDTCRSLGMAVNFGGFRGILDPNIAFLFSKRI